MARTQLAAIFAIGTTLWAYTAKAIDADEAAKIAGDTGCGILATLLQNPQAAVAAAGACILGASVANDAVAKLIDEYFKGQDQAFANKYCLTIVHANGKKTEPIDKRNCGT